MLPQWLTDETSTVGEYESFLDAGELEAELAAVAAGSAGAGELRRVGTSRLGSPIHALTVGEGPEDAVVFGLPHPNEPVGGLTALHLARRLCADPALRRHLGHRWHVVACVDPDGLRLNQGWLRGPFTRTHYSRHFYRPAGDEQVEWTFPLDHKQAYFDRVLPETLALMRLIDRTRPRLLGSLHNSEHGGAYYYISRRAPALHPVLQELPEHVGIPLDRGEPESVLSETFAAGIFGSPRLAEIYDDAEAHGEPLPLGAGDSCESYAARHGTFTLVGEVPYWTDDRFSDPTPTSISYAQLLRTQADDVEELAGVLRETVDAVAGELLVDSPYLRAVRFFATTLTGLPPTVRRRAAGAGPQRRATVAEVASIGDVAHSFRLRYGGMLARLLDAEVGMGNVSPTVYRMRDTARVRQERWCTSAEEEDRSRVLPIRSLVATQYGALIATARHLHESPDDRPDAAGP